MLEHLGISRLEVGTSLAVGERTCTARREKVIRRCEHPSFLPSIRGNGIFETAVAQEVQGPACRVPDKIRSQTPVEGS